MEMVSCTTLGAISSISVTVASCSISQRVYRKRSEGSSARPAAPMPCALPVEPKMLRFAQHSPHPRLGQLLDPLEQTLLLESAQPVDEQSALEVIGLVAQDARHQAFTPYLAGRAVAVEEA